ncbi:MAG: cob(I)yrinic acid a,c-diamide adenosyltransferase [Bacteroidales bacterium]|nr:cob(I)yrinic acid a,c-diamide adenosyltransferase [Bacteroidales bacterium]
MAKIYTKKGDNGSTTLVGGQSIAKSDPILDSYGTVDELNAFIGLTIAEIESKSNCDQEDESIINILTHIQNQLFNLGGLLATLPGDWSNYWPGKEEELQEETAQLETHIDLWEKDLEPIRQFILPHGNRLTSLLHICRTICRRAERDIAQISSQNNVYFSLLQYVNRLSDFFFILVRVYHKKENIFVTSYKSTK